MKFFPVISIVVLSLINGEKSFSQNVLINVLTHNSGIILKDSSTVFEVSISNTSAIDVIPAYTLRPQISFPNLLVTVPNSGHILPSGWKVLSNINGVITFSNGEDVIGQNENRTLLIKFSGKAVGGPNSIVGNLFFSNGIAPGVVAGRPLKGDSKEDNSASSIVVVK